MSARRDEDEPDGDGPRVADSKRKQRQHTGSHKGEAALGGGGVTGPRPFHRAKSHPAFGRKASSFAATRGWRCDARGPEGVIADPGLAAGVAPGNQIISSFQFLVSG